MTTPMELLYSDLYKAVFAIYMASQQTMNPPPKKYIEDRVIAEVKYALRHIGEEKKKVKKA